MYIVFCRLDCQAYTIFFLLRDMKINLCFVDCTLYYILNVNLLLSCYIIFFMFIVKYWMSVGLDYFIQSIDEDDEGIIRFEENFT